MSNRPDQDPEDPVFKDLVAKGMQELRHQRGPCPSAEALVEYHHGRLPAEQSAEVRKHVEACGLCDVLLSRLQAGPFHARDRNWRQN